MRDLSFALVLVVPVAVGLTVLYALLRRRHPPEVARAMWWRVARFWTPSAIMIIVAAELIWH